MTTTGNNDNGGVRFYLPLENVGPLGESRWAKKQVLLDLHIPAMLKASVRPPHRVAKGLTVVDGDGAVVMRLSGGSSQDHLLLLDRGTAEYEDMRRVAANLKAQLENVLEAKVRTEIYAYL